MSIGGPLRMRAAMKHEPLEPWIVEAHLAQNPGEIVARAARVGTKVGNQRCPQQPADATAAPRFDDREVADEAGIHAGEVSADDGTDQRICGGPYQQMKVERREQAQALLGNLGAQLGDRVPVARVERRLEQRKCAGRDRTALILDFGDGYFSCAAHDVPSLC